MYPLFETICILNGTVLNMEWHQKRYELSYRAYYHTSSHISIIDGIVVPEDCKSGLCKMRIAYNKSSKKVEFESYTSKEIRSLKLVEDNSIEYGLKFTDRNYLNNLVTDMRGDCDDILIIKNGMVTDSSYSNIVFYNGVEWITPSTPLLKGTARERLLQQGIIKAKPIHLSDIHQFLSFKLINAMRDFDTCPETNTNEIRE
jgi:4-amino-4-deoxychorismate lyase